MDWHLPKKERRYLRELAQLQADLAALPIMQARKRMWYDLNDGLNIERPPVIIETMTFDRDFLPASVFKCTSHTGQQIEKQLLRNIRNHEFIDDDKVMPDTFDIAWFTTIDRFAVTIERRTVKDSQGVETGYELDHPIKDIKRDLERLRPATCHVDREKTLAYKEFATDLLGDLLPVTLRSYTYGNGMLTHRVVDLMGMEAFFLAMYDAGDEVHRLMRFLCDNELRIMRWAEAEGILELNSGNQMSFGSSYNFTHRLPAEGFDRGHVRLCDMFGTANSQETVGVAPAMFHEFCWPYYCEVCQPLGLVYYGCCEPAHPFWDDLQRLPHLKKISISRWCDERFMGEALQGTGIVYSRKPDPNFFSVDVKLDEQKWAEHIRDTLEATRGVAVEFIMRDVYTVHGNLDKPKRAVAIARRVIDEHFKR